MNAIKMFRSVAVFASLISLVAGACQDVVIASRVDCGWVGITQQGCEQRGCCYDETTPEVKWCFYGSNVPTTIAPTTMAPTTSQLPTTTAPLITTAAPTATANIPTTTQGEFIPSSTPVHIIPGTGSSVTGVTSLGEELFVVREGSPQITVYSVSTFTVTRQLQVGVTASSSSLAADSINNCVYMSNPDANKVYRVELTGSNTVTSWSTGSWPLGLSVNSAGNVLVVCNTANKIQEYTTTGSLVREISLQSGIVSPLNVVQLSNNQFGVTHIGGYPWLERYCVVGLDGSAVKCYGSSYGSGVGQMNGPWGLTLNQHGTVFIADSNNHRVLMLNPSTFNATKLAVDGGLQTPYCVHYDKSRDQLYIGEYDGQQRVVVLGK